jgi:hypothetical protein
MLCADLADNITEYEHFKILEISNLDEFMEIHELLHEVFIYEYGIHYKDRNEIEDEDMQIISILLNYFQDKHFIAFQNNDQNHQDLKKIQELHTVDFGTDLNNLDPEKIYILEMSKKSG